MSEFIKILWVKTRNRIKICYKEGSVTFHSWSRLLPHADIFLSLPRRRHSTGRRSSLRLLTGRRSSLRLFLLKATDRPARSCNCCGCPAGSCCCCWPAGSSCCCWPAGSCCCYCWPARSCSLPAAPAWRSSWCTVDFLLIRLFCRWFDYSGELKWTAGAAAACVCSFSFFRGEGEGAAGVSGCCTATVSRDFVFAGFFGVLIFFHKIFGPPKSGSA